MAYVARVGELRNINEILFGRYLRNQKFPTLQPSRRHRHLENWN
jgi:hypothetical protein